MDGKIERFNVPDEEEYVRLVSEAVAGLAVLRNSPAVAGSFNRNLEGEPDKPVNVRIDDSISIQVSYLDSGMVISVFGMPVLSVDRWTVTNMLTWRDSFNSYKYKEFLNFNGVLSLTWYKVVLHLAAMGREQEAREEKRKKDAEELALKKLEEFSKRNVWSWRK